MKDGELDTIEYYDPIRQSNISIVVKKQDGIDMVQAISFCFKDSPFPLADIFNIESGTFISIPRGFQGAPVKSSFVPRHDDLDNPKKAGCGGCGKGDSNGAMEFVLEVK